MDNSEALQLLEELDQIRVSAGMSRMDENSRRDFLKKMGAGAAGAVAGAAGMAAQGEGKISVSYNEYHDIQDKIITFASRLFQLRLANNNDDRLYEMLDALFDEFQILRGEYIDLYKDRRQW